MFFVELAEISERSSSSGEEGELSNVLSQAHRAETAFGKLSLPIQKALC